MQRMPRIRRGYVHVVNNDYFEWKMYAIGGSAGPTVNSEDNRFTAPADPSAKEVMCLHCMLNLLHLHRNLIVVMVMIIAKSTLLLCKSEHMHTTVCVCRATGDEA